MLLDVLKNLDLENKRVLLLAPGPRGYLLKQVREQISTTACYWLDSAESKLKNPGFPCHAVRGAAARLPFQRHAFDLVVSLEALFAIRPPWTILAEFHRVLIPDGKLMLFEPASLGFFSTLRDKIYGPGKRVFLIEELQSRLQRADFKVTSTHHANSNRNYPLKSQLAICQKVEFEAEARQTWRTARELKEIQKQNKAQQK